MSKDGINVERRRFLTAATTVIGGIGAAYIAVPFLASWRPSAKAEAAGAPVEVDISKLNAGEQITIEWRGKPVWIVRRTDQMLAELPKLDNELRDPNSLVDQQPKYCQNESRSIKPEYFVAIGICTHLGCVPTYRPQPGSVDATWPGGFFCPCHGSKFDMAGRVYKGVPAPTNLEIPPYKYLADTQVIIGVDEDAKGGAPA
ncbi:MAG: ubiquinol-cytochrome c reductase iron-sulfur subunit [Gammaproteobacteria bacterium]